MLNFKIVWLVFNIAAYLILLAYLYEKDGILKLEKSESEENWIFLIIS